MSDQDYEEVEHVETEQPVDVGEQLADQEPAEATEQASGGSDKDYNFKRLREEKERLEKEREQDRQMMMALQQELMKRQEAQAPAQPQEEEFQYSGDDWITYEQFDKLSAKKAQEAAVKAVEEYRQKQSQKELPERLRSRYNDFDDVVSESNIEKLKTLEPEIAKALSQIKDQESQAVAAYKYIKSLVPQSENNDASRKQMDKRSAMPKSPNSVAGQSALSQAAAFENGLTSDLKQQLYREMVEASKRA